MTLHPPSKRCRLTREKSISPPCIRQGLTHDPVTTITANHSSFSPSSSTRNAKYISTQQPENQIKSSFEILSWNVNGIGHLLPSSNQNITSFLTRKPAISRRNAVDIKTDSESQSAVETNPIPINSNDLNKEEKITGKGNGKTKETQDGSPIRAFLQRHNFPQIVCLQEVKISPSDEGLKKLFETAVNLGTSMTERNTGHEYDISYSLPRDRFNARGPGGRGKVYGVCTLTRRDLLRRPRDTCVPSLHKDHDVDEPDKGTQSKTGREETEIGEKAGTENTITTYPAAWDLEGRVLITTIPHLNLAIINGYWVNGTSSPWRHSSTGAILGTRHDAKRKFHSEMLQEVQAQEQKGYHVVLVGDMNVARDEKDGFPGIRLGVEHVKNREDFNSRFFGRGDQTSMNGVDTYRYLHGDERGYTYHGERAEEWGRSCDRVDLGIVSWGLVERGGLVRADIWESVEERGGSDHVPIGVVLDVGSLEEERRD